MSGQHVKWKIRPSIQIPQSVALRGPAPYPAHMQQAAATRPWVAVAPSALSVLRIALAALFPFVPGNQWRASIVLVAGLSDMADGFVARRLGVASAAGGQLDAMTDKVFVLCVLITFLSEGRMQPWQVALLLTRDVVVVVLATYVAVRRQWSGFLQMPARLLGKLTTVAMFTLFLAAVLWPPEHLAVQILFAVTALLGVVASIDYLIQLLKARRRVTQSGYR